MEIVPPFAALLPGGAATAGLVLASDGNYYGAERLPGQNPCRPEIFPGRDCGVIVRVSPTGDKTILHRFGLTAGDEFDPGPLVLGDDGAFYGATNNGGAFGGGGTIFRITQSGSYTILHSFSGANGDGAGPGFLTKGSDGNFYGTTASGGANRCPAIPSDGPNCGTVYRITPEGNVTILHSFGSTASDGVLPEARLVEGEDGRLYGTTQIGGTNTCGTLPNSCGTLFSISKAGALAILHSFGSATGDGIVPRDLIRGPGDSIVGFTVAGGGSRCSVTSGCGTVFTFSAGSGVSVLYAFGQQNQLDGSGPSSLTLGTDGNFYGTTTSGGQFQCSSCGTVFRLTTAGRLTTLHSFGPVNTTPSSPTLISRSANGVLYGFMQFNTSFDGTPQYFRLTEL
ncbi:choice-of-anchor tandem repeat GloVer-containing protein [Porphyrobacter sp. HT-58-2]|uniref:choice-of-anchor tandem repeat GloVer-containing protein n=1 Tax=Porphyrobacter sp. HT-58-2 TaxID=2023229 RepID=UPI0015589A66|nr:choice-of-anchor tandem repeat GloVer-containing protein [Porphyrobacter sp. HT-58-2]